MVEVLTEEMEEGRSAHVFNMSNTLQMFEYFFPNFIFPFSVELFGDLEETEWKDTIELYKEKVKKKQIKMLCDFLS